MLIVGGHFLMTQFKILRDAQLLLRIPAACMCYLDLDLHFMISLSVSQSHLAASPVDLRFIGYRRRESIRRAVLLQIIRAFLIPLSATQEQRGKRSAEQP